MSDPGQAPLTLHPEDQKNADAANAVVTKPSDLGSFNPPTIPELSARLEALEVLSVKHDDVVLLLRKQMDYLINTYFREPHFPKDLGE